MKVSIIIPAHNVEKYIRKCLASVINQSFDKSFYEVIVINDCSHDKTLKIINEYSKRYKNFYLINNKKIEGPGFSRNHGIKVAKGKYILFLDGDDSLYYDALKILYTKATLYKTDVLGYNFSKIKKNGKKIFNCRKDLNKICANKNKVIKDFLYGEIDGSVIFSFIRKKIISKNKIRFKKGLHEDVLFIFKVYYFSQKIKKINKNLYIKLIRKTSITHNYNCSRFLDLLKAFKSVYEFLKRKNNALAKKCHHLFIRGLVGCVGHLLIINYNAWNNNKKKRFKNYNVIYKNSASDLSKLKLQEKTFKDKVTNLFLFSFNNFSFYRDKVHDYEKKYNNLKIIYSKNSTIKYDSILMKK